MKKLITTTLLFTSLILFGLAGNAQNFEGVITYEITYENMDEAMAQYEAMFPKQQVTKIRGKKTKVEQKGGMGGTTTVIIDAEEGTTTRLIDQMGQKKYYVTKNKEEEVEEETDKQPEIKYYDDDTKEIAGYECKRGELIFDENQPPMIFYYTEEIQAPKAASKYERLKGYMMEYEIETPQFTMILTAKDVSEEKVSKGEFKVPSDYEKMSDEEVKKMEEQAKSQF